MNSEYEVRFGLLRSLVTERTHHLRQCLESEDATFLRKRKLRKKTDGTGITRIEYAIGAEGIDNIDRMFPDDSCRGEETPYIEPSARFEWVWDESDNTKETSRWRKPEREQYTPQATPAHLLACIDHGDYGEEDHCFAFGAGYPLRNEVFTGCHDLGIFRNNRSFVPIPTRSSIIIGINEHETENNDFLSRQLGTKLHGFNAGAMPFFFLYGHIGGAVLHHDTKNVEELPCTVAVANLLGATVTDERGRPYRFHNQQPNIDARVVITLPHLSHCELTMNSKIFFR